MGSQRLLRPQRIRQRPGQVVMFSDDVFSNDSLDASPHRRPVNKRCHEYITRLRMAERLAALKGYEFAGEYSRNIAYDALYFVPPDTLLRNDARELGIQHDEHVFGGCVSEPWMSTKSITHPLIVAGAESPPNWSADFATAVGHVVLPGYTVFCARDARRAATEILRHGKARFKPALGIGGGGQRVIRDLNDLDDALTTIDPFELQHYGVVIEQNLDEVVTYSVGQVYVAGIRLAYYGEQHLTKNHRGHDVYGGSTLHVVRGNLQTLRGLELPGSVATAIKQACRYDHAATIYLPGFMASRRNYDIATGIDRYGNLRSGVLEQSWRIGGASPAEITALEAFAADRRLQTLQVSTHESYTTAAAPDSAQVHFRGIDPRVGAILKYTTIDAYGYTTPQAANSR